MSAPTYIVQKDDCLLIPAQGLTPLTIEWQQTLQNKKASYHTGFVHVKGKADSDQVLFFIQSEWYQDPAHMASIATKVGDHYELKVDNKSRYGQKNASGEARFVVYHDTSRNPYQHRFMNQALRATALGIGAKLAQMLGVDSGLTTTVMAQIDALFGDKLREF